MKRILTYNFVNAIQVFLRLVFQVLLARHFGASLFTDVYFVSIIIIEFVSTIGAFFTEMFMQYYNDVRVNDPDEAKRFYQAVFNFSLLTGVALFIITISFMDPVVNVFVPGFDAERRMVLNAFIIILAFSLIWTRLIALNTSLLNAEMRFMLPYLTGLLIPAFNIIALLFFVKDYGINAIAFSILFSGIIGLVIQQIYISRLLNISFGARFWHAKFGELIKKSVSMRIGYQIWSLRDPITTNILSHFPTGTVSLYFYALRIITILFAITNHPFEQVFSSKVSRLVSNNDFLKIRALLKRILIMNTGLFMIVVIPFVFFLSEFLGYFFGKKFSAEDIKTIHYVFLALIPFHLIWGLEGFFVNITVAMKQSFQVIKINLVFIVIFVAFVFLFKNIYAIYAIPIALMIAQSYNFIVYLLNVQKIFKKNLWNIQPSVTR